MRTNLCQLVQRQAELRPEAPALTFKGEEISYVDLWRRATAVAEGLRDLGLGSSERVAVFAEKRPETVTSFVATAAAGGAFVPLNPLLRAHQVAYILGDCDVRVLITTLDRLEIIREQIEHVPSLRTVVLMPGGTGATAGGAPTDAAAAGGFDVVDWTTLVDDDRAVGAGSAEKSIPARTIDIDIAAIFYTSGSTGQPKGVVLSHRNLIVGAESVNAYLGNTADDVILSALPLSFDAGFSQLTTAFDVGAHVILHNYLLPRDVVRLCGRHAVTALTCVPPLWIQLAGQAWPPDVGGRLRYFANTGGRMPKQTLAQLRDHFPQARPFLMYGLTEAFRSTYLDPSEVDRRPDSIGKAIPNAEILVLRPDGSRCEPGEEGELVHRGALVAHGYWNDPDRTAERFRPVPSVDGARPEIAVWSGDTVTSDDDGFLYFVGRRDDMIKTSGYRVSPTEIEEAAYDTGLVTDAVALGLDDDSLGHRIVTVVTARESELDVDAFLTAMRGRLPLYMVPHQVAVRTDLPRSPNGKFDRVALREELTS